MPEVKTTAPARKTTAPELVTIGESMIVLRGTRPGLLRHSETFSRSVGGAESNVAIGITRLGHSAGWISRLGDDEIGHYVLDTIRGEGVDVSRVRFDPQHNTGLYLKELSSVGDPRVVYYRQGSAASYLRPADLDEAYIRGARLLHITGIPPALSPSCREATFAAVEIARSAGVPISFDPNVRLKLWNAATARPVLLDLARHADIVLPGLSEGELLTGEPEPLAQARYLLAAGAKLVAIKTGPEGAVVAGSEGEDAVPGFVVSPVDTVGAGDAFAAAFLAGYLEGRPQLECARRGCAAGALATLDYGDWEGLPSTARLEQMLREGEAVPRNGEAEATR